MDGLTVAGVVAISVVFADRYTVVFQVGGCVLELVDADAVIDEGEGGASQSEEGDGDVIEEHLVGL